jgi:spermidine synthase
MDIRYEVVDRDPTAFGELVLRRYVAETGESGYEILLDGAFLMASHGSHSERAMARAAHDRLGGEPRDLHALVGGLGAGHTLRAVLDLPGVEHVTVAEIGPLVEEWNRRFFADANGSAVDDPRVRVQVADVLDILRASLGAFHLVLLDVDNGPGWLASPANAALYSHDGLEACIAALAPGGVLAVWSPARNPAFRTALEAVLPTVEELSTTAEARAEGEPASVIYLGTVKREE